MEEAETCIEPTQAKPAVWRTISENKLQVKWPGALEKKQCETINKDLTKILQSMSGTDERNLDKIRDILFLIRVRMVWGKEQTGKSTSTKEQFLTTTAD